MADDLVAGAGDLLGEPDEGRALTLALGLVRSADRDYFAGRIVGGLSLREGLVALLIYRIHRVAA